MREGLAEGETPNLLVSLLEWNTALLTDFDEAEFEVPFGGSKETVSGSNWEAPKLESDGIELILEGKIDKVLLGRDGSTALATDYKTGVVERKDLLEGWSSQFPVYYLALKEKFPGKRVILAYEQLKSLKKNEHGVHFLVGDVKELEIAALTSIKGKNNVALTSDSAMTTGDFLDLDLLKATYIELARKIAAGEFHIARRELEGEACLHCDFDRLCRKSCAVL